MEAYSSGGMEANSSYDDEAYLCRGVGANSCMMAKPTLVMGLEPNRQLGAVFHRLDARHVY